MEILLQQFKLINIKDIIDILLVAFVFYKAYGLIKETRAEQLLKGLILIFLAANISDFLQLYTVNWISNGLLSVGTIALLIVFQPELRRALEYFGRSSLHRNSFKEARIKKSKNIANEIVEACASLSRQRIGALIVMEQNTGMNEVIETGTSIEGELSSGLLINIFIPNTPLHDGAVIIKDDTIRAAGCFLPLTDNKTLSKELGTRHRAALGISENSDSLSIVVSEETGAISVAQSGDLRRHLDNLTLKKEILKLYEDIDGVKQSVFSLSYWRDKLGEKEKEEQKNENTATENIKD